MSEETYDIPQDEHFGDSSAPVAPSSDEAVVVAPPKLTDAGESVTETFAAHEGQKPYFRGRLASVVTAAAREEFLSEFCDTDEKREQLGAALDGLGVGKAEGGV